MSTEQKIEIQLERLKRHFLACRESYDSVALLDLSHALRIIGESKIELNSFLSNDEKLMLPSCVRTKKLKRLTKTAPFIMALFPRTVKLKNLSFEIYIRLLRSMSQDEIKDLNKILKSNPTKLYDLDTWFKAEAITWRDMENGEYKSISRERIIKRIANYLGGSHPEGEKETASYDDKVLKDLMRHSTGDRPLPYMVLMSIAQELLTSLKLLDDVVVKTEIETKFEIAPMLKGKIILRDLLDNQGSFCLFVDREFLASNGDLFRLQSKNLNFSLSIRNYSLIAHRNGSDVILHLSERPSGKPLGLWLIWNYTELALHYTFGNDINNGSKKATVNTAPSIPPNSLFNWARKNNLLPIAEYNNEEEFRHKVHSCLQSIQDKINDSGAYSQFWDTTYSGQKIINRSPKKEIEVQPIIHSLLSDQFLMSSIEIIPEFNGSVGNLDFLFIAKVKGEGSVYFCVEFKNAHSNDLINGLHMQLPTYMENKKAQYGAYCVLNYQGQYFDKPKLNGSIMDVDKYLLEHQLKNNNHPYMNNIRVFNFILSKPISASKIKAI